MDYSNMAPGGLIPQLGAGAAVIPEDLDFGIQPDANPLAPEDGDQGMYDGDVPSYMQDAPPESEESPMEQEVEEPQQELGIGSIKKCKDGSEWLITHWCEVCRVGLCSEKQLEVHNAGKPHEKKMKAMCENTAAYGEFIRMKDGGMKRAALGWHCDVCDNNLTDADQYQLHLKGKPHERKLRVRAGNTRVFDYFCDLCGINTGNNRMVYDSHLEGQKHQKRLWNGKLDLSIADPGETAYYCEICKIHMDCASQYISHLGGQQHLKRMKGDIGPESEISDGSGLLSPALAGGKGNTYWCDTCKITMTGHQPFEAHMNGAKHKAKVAACANLGPPGAPPMGPPPKTGQKRGFNAPGSVPYFSGPTGSAQSQTPRPPKAASKDSAIDQKCDVCNVKLKTQSSYDAHMQGQLHLKKKKMIEAMGGRVIMPAGSLARKILDHGPMVKEGVLHCPLCDMNFMTLQIAQEHFPGRKHRGAMRSMQMAHENESSGGAGWITGASTLNSADSAAAPTTDAAAAPFKNFVSGGTMTNLATLGLDLDKDAIDAKIKEARLASGLPGQDDADKGDVDADKGDVDAHVKAFQEAQKDAGDSKEGTPAAEGDADAMDLLVREVSPHDTTAIVCDICNIGVTTTQMLENHVIGSKHLKKVLSVAVGEGKDIKGIRGRGVPFNRGRGRGGGGGMGRGRGRGGGGGFRGRGGGFGGVRGGGRPVVSPMASIMAQDNDGSSHDYMSVKHKPPMGYPSRQGNNVNPGWASWNDNHQPGSGGWTTWTG